MFDPPYGHGKAECAHVGMTSFAVDSTDANGDACGFRWIAI
jgi:hypothetical protein